MKDSASWTARAACRLAIGVALASACSVRADSAAAAPIDGIHNIQHVVVIMQENRSFDSYFGTYPGANGIPAHVCVPDPLKGGCMKPFHAPATKNVGGPHGFVSATEDINAGRMDGFVRAAEKLLVCHRGDPECPKKKPCGSTPKKLATCIDVMGYHDAREIPNYWTYAHQFVLQDNMYEPVASSSGLEHMFMVSAWSAICPRGSTEPLECAATVNPPRPNATYAWTDITYLLNRAHVSWNYYVYAGGEPDCTGDESLVCEPAGQSAATPSVWNPLPKFTDVKQDGQLGNVQSINGFYTAVHQKPSCGLANVAWINPNFAVSEHPPAPLEAGQAYVTTLVNAIMRSPCWGTTAIFLSWDDWGGFYDHVSPPKIDSAGYGLRVPGLVISPFSKPGFVDKQQLSHDAYLKFIEDDFLAGARLNPSTDGRPDRRPNVREEAPGLGDLSNDFNFMQTPQQPVLLSPHPEPGPPSQPPEASAPSVVTRIASKRKRSQARLNATVNPNGSTVTDCHFDYGVSASYGHSAPCAPSPGAGFGAVAVSSSVSALSANTAYHFRVVATNAGGTSFGLDSTFATKP
jgi:phospholipase C